ncbi:MAG: AMP-binding protein [Thermoleophilaceae bacterium]
MTDPGHAIEAWEVAAGRVSWMRGAERTHVPGPRGGRWFPGAELNVSLNCLDRHLAERGDRVALHWEGEPGDRRAITYRELHEEVCAFAGALSALGVGAGDRVALHLGLLPETVVAMLACTRVGAVHAVMAAALPADALADRLVDFDPKLLLTQDGSWRHGVMLPLKARADEAMAAATGVEHTVVVRRTGVDVGWYEGDLWYDELVAGARAAAAPAPAVAVRSDHPLLACYIANRRGRPTGIVHGTGGLLTHAMTIHADGLVGAHDDVFWIPADVAWLATQVHAVYGPLACGATSVLYEGMLDTPSHERAWEIVERYGVNTIVTTPSVVRNLRRWTDSRLAAHDLGSLGRIVTAGERIDPSLRDWLATEVGGASVRVADGWGQTELGGVVLLLDAASGGSGLPDPGVDIVDTRGRPVAPGSEGELVLRHPWPATFLRIWGDDGAAAARLYWSRHPDAYATGDRAVRAGDGSLAVLGRIDPVVSVSGQLVSLTEIGEALLEHPFIRAAEVVACPDPPAGEALAACVALRDGTPSSDQLAWALRGHVRERLGGLAYPRTIAFLEEIPDDLERDDLRHVLRLLCATASSENVWFTREQLRAAAAGLRGT